MTELLFLFTEWVARLFRSTGLTGEKGSRKKISSSCGL